MEATMNMKQKIVLFAEKHKHHPCLKFIAENGPDIVISDICGNGVINFIYLVQNQAQSHSVILKYGTTTAHKNSELEVSMERQSLEFQCLREIHNIKPGYVPEPYIYDDQMSIIAMEYLGGMETLGDGLRKGDVCPEVAAKLGKMIGHIACVTHRKLVTEERWSQLRKSVQKDTMKDIQIFANFTAFTIYMTKGDGKIVAPPDGPHFKRHLSEVLECGMFGLLENLWRREDCMIQFDSNNNSFMFSRDRVAIIDFEFGCLGNCYFSISELIAFYYMATKDVKNKMQKGDEAKINELTIRCLHELVDAFLNEFKDHPHVLDTTKVMMSEVALMAGYHIFHFPNYTLRELWCHATKEDTVEMTEKGFQLMMAHDNISTLNDILDLLFGKEQK